MHHLGNLSGRGQVLVAGQAIGSVQYRIDIYRDDHLKEGSGTLEGPLPILKKLVDADEALLELEDGRTVKIVVHRWTSEGIAQLVTSGSIPGF